MSSSTSYETILNKYKTKKEIMEKVTLLLSNFTLNHRPNSKNKKA